MVFYRFNQLSQGLKATSAGIFSVSVKQASAATPKYVYKPILGRDTIKTPSLIHTASASGHSGAPVAPGLASQIWADGSWKNWKSWEDVPDIYINKTSKLDPNNRIYSDPSFIRLRKEQIWSQRPGDVPVYLNNGTSDQIKVNAIWVIAILMTLYNLYNFYKMVYKKYYPEHNLFILF